MKGIRWVILLPLSLGALAACHGEDKPTDPSGPGVLELVLTTPNANDGAVLLEVTGAVDSVQPMSYTTFSSLESGGARVVVTGDIASGVVARLYVPDAASAGQYTGSLSQAAQRSSFTLQNLTGYRVVVRRVP